MSPYLALHGFDPKSLTDKELFDHQFDLLRKQVLAERLGKADTVDQIRALVQSIEFERRERMFNEHIGTSMKEMAGVVIETDPVMRAFDEARRGDSGGDGAPRPDPVAPSRESRPVRRPVRSSQPLRPKEIK